MRVLTVGVLSVLLLTAGCTRQQVNSVSVFEYEKTDEAGEIALKTAGNFIPWVGGAVIYTVGAFAWVVTGGGQQPVSGSVSSKGVSYSNR